MTLATKLKEAEQLGVLNGKAQRQGETADVGAELSDFGASGTLASLVLRRFLINLGVPPRWLAFARRLAGARRTERVETFLTRYAYWRGVRRGIGNREIWNRLSRGPLILMYHAIGTSAEVGTCYVVAEKAFRRQMAWLRWRGYHMVTLRELLTHRRRGLLPPAKSVALTFDDGYADNCEVALPVLRRYGYVATVYVVTGRLGGVADWTTEPAIAGRPLLTAEQVRRLLSAGIEIGAHTRNHVSLTEMASPEALEAEVLGSRLDLERQFGVLVRTFAYPYGDFDDRVAEVVRIAGFEAACCSRSGVNGPEVSAYQLRRIEVRGTDTLSAFARMLWRGHRSFTPPVSGSVTG